MKISGIDLAIAWDISDKNKVKNVIQFTKYKPAIGLMFLREIERIRNDQTPNWKLEPQQVGFTTNKMTDAGIERHAELICGTSSKLFNYYAVGTGTSTTTSQSIALDTEIARVYMDSDDGFRVAAGMDIIECGYFDETYPTFTAAESGVFDGDGSDPDSEVMEWRSTYPASQQVTHTVNVNFMTYIHAIFMQNV